MIQKKQKIFIFLVFSECLYLVITLPLKDKFFGQFFSIALAIDAAALPAPITNVLPFGGFGNLSLIIFSGLTASKPALNELINIFFVSIT